MDIKKPIKLLAAYALGQITQLVLHGMVVSLSMWDNKRVVFCAAGGFIILFAAVVGVFISTDKSAGEHAAEKKSYLDWAKIPEDEAEVVNPFGKDKK